MERTTAKEAAAAQSRVFPKASRLVTARLYGTRLWSILERIQAANDYYFETQFEERLIALDEVLQNAVLCCT